MTITFDKNAVQEKTQGNNNKDFNVGKVYFVVDDAEERKSEKSGQFILLKLTINNNEGQTAKITTCLFFTDKMLWRVKQFCTCVGEDRLFDSESISCNAFVGLEGEAIVDRNPEGYINVKRFLQKTLTLKKPEVTTTNKPFSDEDIPF